LNINSTGSSTVTICFDDFELIVLINVAKVVDFQEPTPHVTKINPFFIFIKSNNFSGNHNSFNDGKIFFIGLKTIQIPFCV